MIPKIIHQIWDGPEDSLPDFFIQLGETWKAYHPTWQYELWDGKRMDSFVINNYPNMADIYFNYKYNIQRWDVFRYLLLYKTGGMYVDFDYECLASFDDYLAKDKCYFPMEPEMHCRSFGKDIYFGNALMITPPGHLFFESVIAHLQNTSIAYTANKLRNVLNSTGPLMLTNLYEKYINKTDIHLFSPEQIAPWSKKEVQDYINGIADNEMLAEKLENAIAIHYFWSSWLNNDH